jgi:hypothetical protein
VEIKPRRNEVMHIRTVSKNQPAQAFVNPAVFDKIQIVATTITSVRAAIDAFSKTAS